MKNSWVTIFVAIFFSVFQSAAAQSPTAPSAREIRAKVDEYMKSAVEFEPFSGTILIARDGRPIVSKGYGMANIEFDAPNNPQTVFRLASVSKQFTAAAIMILQERGKLNVNDLACKHLEQCPAAWQTISIRHLLTMTHGIPNITALEIGSLRGLPIPMDQWFETTSKKPLEFSPGEKFRYLNAGYTVLGLIIERVSGRSYGEFLQESIFAPLGMKRTGYEDPLRIIKNRATGYRKMPDTPITNLPYREIIRMYAAGGIYSTSEDLLLWDRALYSERILSKKSVDEMFTPFKEMEPGRGYAYGSWSSQQFGRRRLAHGGNATGFITYFARYPEDRVTVIVLSNNERGSAGKINDVLSAITFGRPYDMPRERKAIAVASGVLEKYVGEYQAQFPPTNYKITIENGKFMFHEIDFLKTEMFAESETDFFLKASDMRIKFIKDANGTVTGFIVDQGDGTLYPIMNGQKVR